MKEFLIVFSAAATLFAAVWIVRDVLAREEHLGRPPAAIAR
jgi:hypothetical protein